MNSPLSQQQLDEFRQILQQRHEELKREIEQALRESREQRFLDLAGEVHDTEEYAVANLLQDLNFTEVDHLVAELREVEDALERIDNGTYGICVDTGQPIEIERLRANPTALRTAKAQEIYEKTHAGSGSPSL